MDEESEEYWIIVHAYKKFSETHVVEHEFLAIIWILSYLEVRRFELLTDNVIT